MSEGHSQAAYAHVAGGVGVVNELLVLLLLIEGCVMQVCCDVPGVVAALPGVVVVLQPASVDDRGSAVRTFMPSASSK